MTLVTVQMRAHLDAPESLDVVGIEAVSDAVRLATYAKNRAGATRLEAAHALVERFASGDASRAEDDRLVGRPDRPAHARLDPQARARDHLAAACQLSIWHATRLVTAGVQIHTRLRRLRSAVARGFVPEQLAIDAACRMTEVDDKILPSVEAEVVSSLLADLDGGHRPSRTTLDRMVDEAIERNDPTAIDDAVDEAAQTRTVRFRPARGGMATLWAKLPISEAELLRRRIETDARAAEADGVPGTIEQLRADALASLAVYTPAASSTTAPAGSDGESIEIVAPIPGADLPRPTLGNAAAAAGQPIRITVISAISQGLPNRVEFVHGAYSSFQWLCQELLDGDDARVRFETIDPAPGALDSPEHALRYVLTAAMVERIRLRDGTCRHPGCSVEAKHCDVDHVIAFNTTNPELGGPSTEWNLMCLCRKHHREKTFGSDSYRPGALGELIIVTATGHEHRTTPTGPLARARNQISEHEWNMHIDRLIAADGQLANPPGTDRRTPVSPVWLGQGLE